MAYSPAAMAVIERVLPGRPYRLLLAKLGRVVDDLVLAPDDEERGEARCLRDVDPDLPVLQRGIEQVLVGFGHEVRRQKLGVV